MVLISKVVDSWIAQEEMPVSAALKVIRSNDPDGGLTDDEIQERNEFIHWYLSLDFKLVMMIPRQDTGDDFYIGCFTPEDEAYNAFNTVDFQRNLRPFNKYGYAMKKIMERVKDLAILHSCISCPNGRQDTQRRYESLVELEFRGRLISLVERYRNAANEMQQIALKEKIAQLNRRILECKRIWGQYAPIDAQPTLNSASYKAMH